LIVGDGMTESQSSSSSSSEAPPSEPEAGGLGAHDAPPGSPAAGSGSGSAAADAGDVLLEQAEAEVRSDIDAVAAERDDYLDALRRLQADFENYRKRAVKQQTEHLERAAQALVEKLLPVLDAAELAVAHGGGEAVEQVGSLLVDTLVREGLEGINPGPGDPFDPNLHEAVVHEPGDGPTEVVELLRAGYRWKGRLLRAAMVKVRG
jgi:molecular chaperone GrpE